MTKFYLVKLDLNWADEFDVRGISVCDSVRYEHEQRVAAENADYEFNEIGFGTNESFTDLSMEELFSSYTFIEISESTYKELLPNVTTSYSAGWGTWFDWPSKVLAEHRYFDEQEEY
jgi:hypothetical protein